jgi:peroxiredoxin (alkyl hydroperoxide reductase subunit C)
MRKQKFTPLWSLLLVGFVFGGCRNSVADRKDEPASERTTGQAKPQIVEIHHKVVPGAMVAARPGADAQAGQTAKVGMKAPDFELPAYHKGKFTKVKLSSLRGKWVLVCFYPGDFTFV